MIERVSKHQIKRKNLKQHYRHDFLGWMIICQEFGSLAAEQLAIPSKLKLPEESEIHGSHCVALRKRAVIPAFIGKRFPSSTSEDLEENERYKKLSRAIFYPWRVKTDITETNWTGKNFSIFGQRCLQNLAEYYEAKTASRNLPPIFNLHMMRKINLVLSI